MGDDLRCEKNIIFSKVQFVADEMERNPIKDKVRRKALYMGICT